MLSGEEEGVPSPSKVSSGMPACQAFGLRRVRLSRWRNAGTLKTGERGGRN